MTVLLASAFRDRYAIQPLRDGGILVDLASGTYQRLNTTATQVCSVLCETDDIVAARVQVAQRITRSEHEADRALRDVLERLQRPGPRRDPPGAFRYLPSAREQYTLYDKGMPQIVVSAAGTVVRRASPAVPLAIAQVSEYLRAIAPKLLFLQSSLVIHGAAFRTQRGVRVISGESGAGKTTTARAFAAIGSELFAEDMLVVASITPLAVHQGSEDAIKAWVSRSAERLVGAPDETVDATPLRETASGQPTAVSEVWFIDQSRRNRTDQGIVLRRLGETDSALALMTSLFLGSTSPETWRRFLAMAGQVASSIPIYEASMPDGLDRLQDAAKRYTENSAS